MSQNEARALIMKLDGDEVRRRFDNAISMLRKRRARRWDKVLGRRADGRVIRPIPPKGASRYGGPIISAIGATELLHAIEDELLREAQKWSGEVGAPGVRAFWCEGCGRARTYAVRELYNEDPRDVRGFPWCRSCTALEMSPEGHLPPWETLVDGNSWKGDTVLVAMESEAA